MSRSTYVVVGAKGGVGATTLAFDLIDRLPATNRVLVDGDLTGRRSHAVWFDVAAALDAQRPAGCLSVASARGKQLIELTRTYEDGFTLHPAAVEAQRDALPADAVVVVDAPQPFAATVRPFIAVATAIVIVGEPSLLGVAATRSMLLAMRRFGMPENRIVVAMNGSRSRDLTSVEIEKAIGRRIAVEIPLKRDRTWSRALDNLVRELPAFAPGAELALQPSAASPVGDRRAAPQTRPQTIAFPGAPRAAANGAVHSTVTPERAKLKAEMHEELMARIDFHLAARAHTDAQKMTELRTQVDDVISTLITLSGSVSSAEEAAQLRREMVQEAVGLGPIEGLLHDDEITEVMVNGYQNVYIERHGLLELTPIRFANDRQVRLVIDRIITPLGRRIDEASPMVDARLPDGSRVNAIVEPLSIDGPVLTIRRFGTRRLRMEDLLRLDSVTEPIADFLRAAVEARLNIILSGGTGAGKTTLLNVVSSFIPRTERIVTIEDAAELLLDQPHVVRLESRPPNIEGSGAVPIRELVRNALRMRPDRIIVGECRSAEAVDMLQAMNTGHDGSLTTIHANSARDALSRIETMVVMSGFDLPVRAIREQVASAIDLVVQLARLRDGSRRVVSISEVVGMEGEAVTMQEIARFRQHGLSADGLVLGTFETTGVQPMCLQRFDEMGIDFNVATLGPRTADKTTWALR